MSTPRTFQSQGILAGYDGSETARVAVGWAASEAARRDCPLTIAYAHKPPTQTMVYGWVPILPPEDEVAPRYIRDRVDGVAAECRNAWPTVDVTPVVREGHPASVLAELAGEVAADQLVLGASGLGAMARVLLGSTSAELVRLVEIPVVVVRDPSRLDQPTGSVAPVVVGVDGTEANIRALEFAFDFAARHDHELHAVHARAHLQLPLPGSPTPTDRGPNDAELTAQIDDQLLAPLRQRYPSVPVRIEVVPDKAAEALIHRSAAAALVVVGSRHHGVLRRMLLGSVSHAVLYHAECSIAVVPGHDHPE